MSGYGFLQVVQHPALLEPQRLCHRQQPLHEPT
jgi:hypothetical protein